MKNHQNGGTYSFRRCSKSPRGDGIGPLIPLSERSLGAKVIVKVGSIAFLNNQGAIRTNIRG